MLEQVVFVKLVEYVDTLMEMGHSTQQEWCWRVHQMLVLATLAQIRAWFDNAGLLEPPML
ncbi:MAG: hypothetical protein NVS4B11_01620 [Ktedonobacteraceae bacterium]